MTGKKRLLSTIAIAAASVAVVCAAGVTLAVTVSENRTSGSITTPDLDLSAAAKNVKVYSAVKADSSNAQNVFYDEYGTAYQYQESVLQGDVGELYFSSHSGGVTFDEKSVTVTDIMPGDKVEFDIEVKSTSTISFQYRAELYVDATQGATLLNQLDFTAGELGLLRKDVTEEGSKTGELSAAVLTDYTEWTPIGTSVSTVESIRISISLPITATQGQGESIKLYYVASGVQMTTLQEDVVHFKTADGDVSFKSLAEGVAFAQANDILEIPVVGSTVLEEGTVEINEALHFVGVKNAEGEYPVLSGVRLKIADGAAATFDYVNFSGASYIDASNATALTLTNCSAYVSPVKYFDEYARTYLSDTAFIVSGSSLTPVRLTLIGNTFAAGKGAAVSLRSPISGGSVLSGNRFGDEVRTFNGTAALIFNGGNGDTPVLVSSNTFYADCALSLGGKTGSTTYLIQSQNNTAFGNGLFADGSAAILLDNGSKLNGNALQCTNLGALFIGGVDVTLNNINRITAGKVTVSDQLSITEFFTKYVAGSMLLKNSVTLYRDGVAYAYLNAAANDLGYVLDEIK